ncbi:MAG: adenylate/guanylate cyclase domain-containing protein [Rhodoferax sp.]
MRYRGWLWLWCGLWALALLGHSAGLYTIGPVQVLDRWMFDARLRQHASRQPPEGLVIIDIDDASLARWGRWPWNRGLLAQLITQLFERQHIQILGLDVILAEADTSGGLDLIEEIARSPSAQDRHFRKTLDELRRARDYDLQLAQVLQRYPVVLSYALSQQTPPQRAGMLPEAAAMEGTFDAYLPDLPAWNGYSASLPSLAAAARASGHIGTLTDSDGVTRRVPLLAVVDGRVYESMPMAISRLVLQDPLLVPGPAAQEGATLHAGLEWIAWASPQGELRLPVDANGALWLRYTGPAGTVKRVSAARVLDGSLPADALRGAIALLGSSASGLVDLRSTPVGTHVPGVEIHATAIDNILHARGLARTRLHTAVEALTVLLLALGLTLVLPRLSVGAASALALATGAGVWAAAWTLGQAGHVIQPASALLAVLLVYGATTVWGYLRATQSKRQIAQLFGQYVPPELVAEMARDPQAYSMEGRSAELTVLFSDIRGFTTVSERMPAPELAAMMNAYLGAMTAVIQRHHGTLDKYIGDAIMAFWGAPIARPDHARQAVLAALAMQERLRQLNQEFSARGWPALKIGVGINTGSMVVGDMGSPIRKAYTVMGDAVNLASRLEGISKVYGAAVVLGEATVTQAGDVCVRELDRIRVKGKTLPVTLFEPLPDGHWAITLQPLWDEFLRHYRSQRWDDASATLERLLRDRPEETLYLLYQQRVQTLRAAPPSTDWDGVTTFETK